MLLTNFAQCYSFLSRYMLRHTANKPRVTAVFLAGDGRGTQLHLLWSVNRIPHPLWSSQHLMSISDMEDQHELSKNQVPVPAGDKILPWTWSKLCSPGTWILSLTVGMVLSLPSGIAAVKMALETMLHTRYSANISYSLFWWAWEDRMIISKVTEGHASLKGNHRKCLHIWWAVGQADAPWLGWIRQLAASCL